MDYQTEDHGLQQIGCRVGETIPVLGLIYKNSPFIIHHTLVRIIIFYTLLSYAISLAYAIIFYKQNCINYIM